VGGSDHDRQGNGDGDARSSDAVSGEWREAGVPFSETPRLPELHPVEDFPREQSRDDTLRFGFDQVIQIDGHMVRPDSALSYPHFSLIRDRLYRVSRDTKSAIPTKRTGIQICISPSGLCNPISRGSAIAHHIREERCAGTVSSDLPGRNPERDSD